jgi:hypothetical protein
MNLVPSVTQQQATEARMRQLQQEQAQLEQQLRVQQFAAQYQTQFSFPALVESTKAGIAPRTDSELIQHRLLEAGLLFEVPTSVGETVEAVAGFVQQLEASGCFNAVQVKLGGSTSSEDEKSDPSRKLTVTLDEKNWYKLYLGGGLKRDAFQQTSTPFGASSTHDTSFLPTAELEASVGLRNVAGYLDTTDLQYTLDTHQMSTWSLQHQRPLYSALPSGFALRDWILLLPSGSQYSLLSKAVWDTVDWELTRSFRECQRLLSVTACTTRQTLPPFGASIEWSLLFRDIIPRRHSSLPYHFDASPEVLAHSGPSVKHSVSLRVEGNQFSDPEASPYFPTSGYQYRIQTEAAVPPGDAGFLKSQADVALHVPVPSFLGSQNDLLPISFHAMGSLGVLKTISFDGLCRTSASFSDRFLMGGPSNFKGFSPAGIGPRAAKTSSSKSSTGDAIGGDFFYKITAMMSAAVPAPGTRMFAFGTVGTCAEIFSQQRWQTVSPRDVLASSRASVGVGLSTTMLGPRLDVTYAWPLRYGPVDHRRNFQIGMGFSMFD